jgi:ubiquinone/menaquinone biosynthesis C-methylase UbiE
MKKDEIENMSYTDFIAFIQETNRCPGGKDTIRRIKNIINPDKDSLILDVGSNTGFNSLELAHITKSTIFGIDVSESCVLESNRKLSEDVDDVRDRVSFRVGSAYNIPFPENNFDLVMAGGATAFMSDKQKAIDEYVRVIKPWGYICITPLFYHLEPPMNLIKKISDIVGTQIKVMRIEDWTNLFLKSSSKLEQYYIKERKIKNRTNRDITDYINYFLNKPHIKKLDQETKKAIMIKWRNYIKIFNENHKYLSYGIIMFRKTNYEEEPEFFKVN